MDEARASRNKNNTNRKKERMNTRHDDKRTLLHLAAETGKGADIKSLLNAGANINAHDDEDNTPLHLAAMGGHSAVFGLLLQAGAEVQTIFEKPIEQLAL